jgi:hypothetical protein
MTTKPYHVEIGGVRKGIVDAASPLDALYLLFDKPEAVHVSYLHFSRTFCRAQINHTQYVITLA